MRNLIPNLAIGASTPAEQRMHPAVRVTAIVLGGSALAALCSHIVLPLYFTPVPLSAQPFAVLLLGLLLRPRLAAATMFAYLAEGAIGLPVFAPGAAAGGGLAQLFGATGGYLMAYPLAATAVSFLWRRMHRGFAWALAAAAAGDLIVLVCGAFWLAIFIHTSALSTLTMAVLPFLPGDALKVALAAGMAAGYFRIRHGTA